MFGGVLSKVGGLLGCDGERGVESGESHPAGTRLQPISTLQLQGSKAQFPGHGHEYEGPVFELSEDGMLDAQFPHFHHCGLELTLVHEGLFQLASQLHCAPDVIEEHPSANGKIVDTGCSKHSLFEGAGRFLLCCLLIVEVLDARGYGVG